MEDSGFADQLLRLSVVENGKNSRNLNGNEIEPIFTTSDTGSLNTGMYVKFMMRQICAGLLHKFQNPDPDPEKAITGMGLNDGWYFHLEPEVIR